MTLLPPKQYAAACALKSKPYTAKEYAAEHSCSNAAAMSLLHELYAKGVAEREQTRKRRRGNVDYRYTLSNDHIQPMTLPPKQQAAQYALRSRPYTAQEYADERGCSKSAAAWLLLQLHHKKIIWRESVGKRGNRGNVDYRYYLGDRPWAIPQAPVPVPVVAKVERDPDAITNNPFVWRTFVQPFREARV